MEKYLECCPYYDGGMCNVTDYHCCKCDMKCDVGETLRNLNGQGYLKEVGEVMREEVIVIEIRIDTHGRRA